MGWTGHGENMGREFFCEKNDFGNILIISTLQADDDFFEKKVGWRLPRLGGEIVIGM